MIKIIPILAMISFFLIYFYFYNVRKNKHKDFEEITNYDVVDQTIYDPYTTDTSEYNTDYREEYKNTYYYKYLRKHTLGFQSMISKIMPLKYLEMLDELLEKSGRKYNMKAIEFVSCFLVVIVSLTVLATIFGVPLNFSILIGLAATYIFPINDVILEPRKVRKKLIQLELPNTLDFFYILMKAGNSFNESLKEISISNNSPLCEEFKKIIDEIENKKIVPAQAYMNSAKRVGLDSYMNFIKAIQASQDLGADIVNNIKEKSNDLKAEYMNEKEKKIEKLEGKIVVPIVVFFMPPVIIAFFGPQMYDMLKAFTG
jgi:pilus assembly protein TadC